MDNMQNNMFNGDMSGMNSVPPTEGAEPIVGAVLAMAYVPKQRLTTVYREDKALQNGTLFPDLDKPFMVEGFKW